MQLLALILDSFRESLDRKIFWILLTISAVVTLAMASIGFDGDRLTFFFGWLRTDVHGYNPLSEIGRAKIVGAVIYLILTQVLGGVGLILMIVATAGSLPAMFDAGAIDLLLVKPISRARLFLYKYLASMVFVFVQSAAFVFATFLVMGLRWNVWAPGYLLCIPLIVLLFSYIYCVSALVAVKTRSSVAAALVSLGAWVVFGMVTQAPAVAEMLRLDPESSLSRSLYVASWIPPKTGDIPLIAARWSGAGTSLDALPDAVIDAQSAQDRAELDRGRSYEEQQMRKSPWLSIGSSLLFEAVVVAWAMFVFCRKDF